MMPQFRGKNWHLYCVILVLSIIPMQASQKHDCCNKSRLSVARRINKTLKLVTFDGGHASRVGFVKTESITCRCYNDTANSIASIRINQQPHIYLNITAHEETFCGQKHKESARELHGTLEFPDMDVSIENVAFLKEIDTFFKLTIANSGSSVAVHLAVHEPCVKFKDHLSSLLKDALEESVATSIENMIRDCSKTKAELRKVIASRHKKIEIPLDEADGNYGLITGWLNETTLIFGCEQERPTFLTDIRSRPMAPIKLHFEPSVLSLEKCHDHQNGKEHVATQTKFHLTTIEFLFVKAPKSDIFSSVLYLPGKIQPAGVYKSCSEKYRRDLPKILYDALRNHLEQVAVAAFKENRKGEHMKQIEVAPCKKPEIVESGSKRRRRRSYSNTGAHTCR